MSPQPDHEGVRGGDRGTLPGVTLSERLLDEGGNRFNAACSRIAVVMLVAIGLIYLETWL